MKSVKENEWYLIYHYENMEKVKVIGEKCVAVKCLMNSLPLTVPGSLSVTFYQQFKKVVVL